MSRFINLPTLLKSAALALALGGAALVAAPAQAAPPQIDLHLGFGGGGFSIGSGRYCLSDHQVRRFLQWQGFEQIRYIDRGGRIVSVRAERHHREYRVTVDRCRARIIGVERIGHRWDWPGNGGDWRHYR